jgi:hypothetical protein
MVSSLKQTMEIILSRCSSRSIRSVNSQQDGLFGKGCRPGLVPKLDDDVAIAPTHLHQCPATPGLPPGQGHAVRGRPTCRDSAASCARICRVRPRGRDVAYPESSTDGFVNHGHSRSARTTWPRQGALAGAMVDAVITAGIASSRAEVVRWAISRIREISPTLRSTSGCERSMS